MEGDHRQKHTSLTIGLPRHCPEINILGLLINILGISLGTQSNVPGRTVTNLVAGIIVLFNTRSNEYNRPYTKCSWKIQMNWWLWQCLTSNSLRSLTHLPNVRTTQRRSYQAVGTDPFMRVMQQSPGVFL